MTLKVLAICYEDPERILGGMGMHVRELYRAMSKRDDVAIDLLTDGEREGSVDYLGFRKHYSDKLACWKPRRPDFACLSLLDIQMLRTLLRLFAEGHRWDLVHVHEWNSLQVAKTARDALGVPMVGTMHLCLTALAQQENPAIDYGSLREADLYMMNQEGALVCEVDDLILCSGSYVDTVRRTFLTDRPVTMIPNGIDLDEWNPGAGDRDRGRAANVLDRDRPVALYVGRIATMKGIQHVLEVVESTDTGWQIAAAGEVNANNEEEREGWELTQRLRAAEREHPERFRWLGFRHGQRLRDLYAAADVVIMPSTHEPFGIVALEAMAMGAPLISTEVDGLGEIVAPEGGDEYAMIIPPRSPAAIIAALDELKDPAKRDELRQLGRRRARDYSWQTAADATVDVYHQATNRRSRT